MKPWERSILEYRPTLGFTPDILAKVLSKPEGSAATYTPTALAIQTTQILGSDLIDNTMATMSRADSILNTLNRCQSVDPAYTAYRAAKDAGDEDLAEQIHLDNIMNIDGNPQLDAVPFLEDTLAEMEEFLGFINRELFDGQADFSDMEKVREAEEQMINMIFYQESTGKAVSYEDLMARVRIVVACIERMQTYQNTVDSAEAYLKSGVKNAIAGDAEGLLYYLSETKDSDIIAMKEAIKVGFNGPASQAVNQITNSDRAGEYAFRQMLDNELSSLRKSYLSIYKPLIPHFADDTMKVGAKAIFGSVLEGMETIASAFEQVAADHMTASILTRTQTETLFAFLQAKKVAQLRHKLLGTFVDEFDPINLDKEVKRFTKHHKLDRDGTLCG